jgi:hypothetical protein
VIVEHGFGRLRRFGIRHAKYFGARKTGMQVAMAAIAAYIGLLAVCHDFGCHLRQARRVCDVWAGFLLGVNELACAWPSARRIALSRPDL